MIILVVAYGAGLSGACLMRDNSVVGLKMDNEILPYFPKETVEEVLAESGLDIGKVDHIALLGKPFSYFERIIDTHLALFPRSFSKFFTDVRDFFNNKLRIKAIAKKSVNFRNDICYVEPADAIARQISKECPLQDATIVVFLRDCLSSRIAGRYQKKKKGLFLTRELRAIVPVNGERSDEVMTKELKELLYFEKLPSGGKMILASDWLFPTGLKENILEDAGNIDLKFLNSNEIFECASRYVFEGVDKQ
jgi:predicted NodU family carbamoyl transferase